MDATKRMFRISMAVLYLRLQELQVVTTTIRLYKFQTNHRTQNTNPIFSGLLLISSSIFTLLLGLNLKKRARRSKFIVNGIKIMAVLYLRLEELQLPIKCFKNRKQIENRSPATAA